jgi:low temperature requirement protein LtrA
MTTLLQTLRDRAGWMRERREGEDDKVAFPELFFDLVFVFSLIQLSHTLAGHYSFLGAVEAMLMILAVWWVWIFTTWVTNWLDPDKMPVRAMLFALMFGALLLSTAINDAFGEKALMFAGAYVAMQVGRSLFTVYALHGHSPARVRDFLRITCWLCVSAIFWIGGALVGGEAQLAIWGAALAIEYVSPAVGFRVPGLGRTDFEEWDVLGAHMAERCALFVLICLGETILVTGRTLAEMEVTPLVFLLAVTSFGSTVTMWWIYFRFGQERAAAQIENDDKPGEVARTTFTYAHIPVVTGIILCAVADEFVLAHPHGAIDLKTASAIIGGPIVFLAGNVWIKRSVAPRLSISHLAGIAMLVLAAPLGFVVEPHILLIITFIILIVVAVWEYLTLKASALA